MYRFKNRGNVQSSERRSNNPINVNLSINKKLNDTSNFNSIDTNGLKQEMSKKIFRN